ncbi:MAG: type II CAAX endopeptidase family protein [Kofleriaceae bacterium]
MRSDAESSPPRGAVGEGAEGASSRAERGTDVANPGSRGEIADGGFAPAGRLHPDRVPVSYIVRILAAVWLGAAVLYWISKLDDLSKWRSRIAMSCVVALDLFVLLRSPSFRSWLWRNTLGQWPLIDAETVRRPDEAGAFSWRVLGILVLVAVSLTIQEYIGDRSYYDKLFPLVPWQHYKLGALTWPGSWGVQSHFRYYHELGGFAWWSGWRVIGYVLLPTLFILCWPKYRLRDVHISFEGFFRHLWIYVFLFACVLPAVLYASTTPTFRHTYPFYRLANRSSTDLWIWEALYSAQFIALEFFFRGFILQGLRKVMGANAVFVMIVPYCMIHYGKPLPETLGAIGAGLILGTLAIRTKSIWGGVLIHIGVALTMDVLALRGCPTAPGSWCGE